ncbi:MAG: CvpA family protein [Hyphomicrobiales bacterium]|nr:CvpA family protein [Hyphomicrobiales bacterium]
MFSYFDVFVSVIVLLTTFTSLLRGFVKDFLSVIVWVGGAISTLYFYPYAAVWMEDLFRNSVMVNVTAILLVFVVSVSILSLFAAMITGNVQGFKNSLVDRIFGAAFGFLKGFLIVSLVHLSIAEISGDDEPEWLTAGETYDYTHAGAEWMHDVGVGVFEHGKAMLEGEEERPEEIELPLNPAEEVLPDDAEILVPNEE